MSEAEARLSLSCLHMSKCHIVENHMPWLLMYHGKIFFRWKSSFFLLKWKNKVLKHGFLPQYVTCRVIPHIILDTCKEILWQKVKTQMKCRRMCISSGSALFVHLVVYTKPIFKESGIYNLLPLNIE